MLISKRNISSIDVATVVVFFYSNEFEYWVYLEKTKDKTTL